MHWQDLARGQGGVIARRQLTASGLSADRIDGLIRRRELIEVVPGVYSPRPVPGSITQHNWTAVLWSGGVLSHRSAAALWGLPVDASTTVHVTVPDGRYRRRPPWVRTHRVPLARMHCTRADGLPVTDRIRTIIDLLRTERLGVARTLLDRAVQQDWLTEYDLTCALRGEPGRTGNGALRRLLAGLEPDAQAESERRLHQLLRRGGVTGWVPQYPVRLPQGTVYLDVALPAVRIAIEVDGRRHHDAASGRFDSDRSRGNELVARGWRLLRVTWNELVDRPDRVLAQIAQLVAA